MTLAFLMLAGAIGFTFKGVDSRRGFLVGRAIGRWLR
jgi:hypothetical protein